VEGVDEDVVEDVEEESPGAISAFAVSSEFETARRILGGPSLLLDEADVELPEEVFAELLVVLSELVVSELDDARRSRGRSGSLSLDELLLVLLLLELLSSELEAARRSAGWLLLPDELLVDDPVDALLAELLAELLEELPEELPDALSPSGCEVSSTASDAAECSSAVPSLTMLIDCAW
jgi:hypothetical protein